MPTICSLPQLLQGSSTHISSSILYISLIKFTRLLFIIIALTAKLFAFPVWRPFFDKNKTVSLRWEIKLLIFSFKF